MLRAVLIALAGSAIGAPAAAAASFVQPVRVQNDHGAFAGPVVAGDHLVWAKTKRHGQIVVQALGPDRRTHAVGRLRLRKVSFNNVGLEGAPGRVGVVASGFDYAGRDYEIERYCGTWIAPLEGPLRRIETAHTRCPALRLSGALTALDSSTEFEQHPTTVRGTAFDGAPVDRAFENVKGFDLNDPWALVQHDVTKRSNVIDLRSGALRWRPPWMIEPRLDDDGSVVGTVRAPRYRSQVAYATPDDPVAHRLPVIARYVNLVPRRGVYAFATPSRVGVVDRAGTVRTLRTFARPTRLDFDGARVAWASTPCALVEIAVWDLAGAPPTLPLRCDLAKPRSTRIHLQEDEDGLFGRPRLRCPAASRHGCRGEWRLVRRSRGRQLEMARGFFQIAPGTTVPPGNYAAGVLDAPRKRRFDATLVLQARGVDRVRRYAVVVTRPS